MAKSTVSIESADRMLAGKLFVPQTPKGSGVVLVHGFHSTGRPSEQYAKQLVKQGITTLSFDLGGHGNSTGDTAELSVNDHLTDVQSAYDYLATQPAAELDVERLGVAGMSYGGYLATLLTSRRAVKSLLLRSPPLYPEDLQDKPRRSYTDEEALQGDISFSNPALEALRHFTGKVLLVVSEHDSVVLPRYTDVYNDAAQHGETHVLEGAQHSLDATTQQLFRPMVVDWAQDL